MSKTPATSDRAAFVRAEGVLVDRGVLSAVAYMAAHRPGFRERGLRLLQTAAAAPLFAALGQRDRSLGNRVAHLPLRDMSEDRIAILAEEYVEDILRDKVLDTGVELLKGLRREGFTVVVLSEGIDEVIGRLVRSLGVADEVHTNRLEYRAGRATGKLLDPVVGGYEGGRFVRDWGRRRGLDLSRCRAYASKAPDVLLLSAVGEPCAVNPDFTLRKAAREANWPILDYPA